MTDPLSTPITRRPDVEQAYQHLFDVSATVDLSGITDPRLQWLTVNRAMVPRYGAVGASPDLDGIRFTPVSADGVPAEWVTTDGGDATRRIVWFHGGGWTAGAPVDYRGMSGTLARLSGASVLMVDYRLAPEHRFPAGLDDCVAAYEWALTNGPPIRGDASASGDALDSISVMGDSAGGNLAAATCLRLIASGGRVPDRLVLVGATLDNISMAERIGLDDPICSRESLSYTVEFYLPDGHSPADPYISPVFAEADDLAQFPPTLLQVSVSEALLHDSKALARRLEKAGVRVNLSLWPGMPHVWHAFLGHLPEAGEALAEIAAFAAGKR